MEKNTQTVSEQELDDLVIELNKEGQPDKNTINAKYVDEELFANYRNEVLLPKGYILVGKKQENEIVEILKQEKLERYFFEKEMNSFYGRLKATIKYHFSKDGTHGTSMNQIMTEKLERINRGIQTLCGITNDLNSKQAQLTKDRDVNFEKQISAYMLADKQSDIREKYGKKLDTLETALESGTLGDRIKILKVRKAQLKAERKYREATLQNINGELEGYLRDVAAVKYEHVARFLDGVRLGTGIIQTYAQIMYKVMGAIKPVFDFLPKVTRQQLLLSRDFEKIQNHVSKYEHTLRKIHDYTNEVTRNAIGDSLQRKLT